MTGLVLGIWGQDLIRAIFKLVWSRRGERGGGGGDAGDEVIEVEVIP